MNEPAISVEGLGKRFRRNRHQSSLGAALNEVWRAPLRFVRGGLDTGHLWALRDVSFELRHGESLALVGANGAGKSVLLKLLARVTKPTAGQARVRGHIGSMLEAGAGFHPDLSGYENIFLGGALLGMQPAAIRRQFDEIVAFSGVADALHTPVKHYSSGMRTRLAFAVAAHLDTQILLVDEVLAVADDAFRARCIARLKQAAVSGKTIILVSHDQDILQRVCQRALWIEDGRIGMDGPVREVLTAYLGARRPEA
ncbi:MAG: ABC transporter ATP-binding protein [Blastocatellia bacterium]